MPELTDDQLAKLAAIKGRATRYEVVVVHPDGRKALILYTARRSKSGLDEGLRKNGRAVIVFLGEPQDVVVTFPRGKAHALFPNGGLVEFSGRTQRDCILAGELPFVRGPAGTASP